jgi:hypothetical protein
MAYLYWSLAALIRPHINTHFNRVNPVEGECIQNPNNQTGKKPRLAEL